METEEIAFYYKDAIEVVNIIADNGQIILGGDVINANETDLDYTYDNWYYQEQNYSEDSVELSKCNALNYINWYNSKFGKDYLYILVFDSLANIHARKNLNNIEL